jgi:hypothetical protein
MLSHERDEMRIGDGVTALTISAGLPKQLPEASLLSGRSDMRTTQE